MQYAVVNNTQTHEVTIWAKLIFDQLYKAFTESTASSVQICLESLMKASNDCSRCGVLHWIEEFQRWGVLTVEKKTYFTFNITNMHNNIEWFENGE
ncbi:hypothetical protein SR70_06655 [Klebsiella aerogenes]|nr:hypothetical protein SR70_06655 [Klebsiella aerogenes]